MLLLVSGHIYLLPALPNVLICGPFPHHLMKTRFNPRFERIDQLTEIADFLDDVASTRTVGDPKTWETFDRAQKKVIISKLQQKVEALSKLLFRAVSYDTKI